MQLTAELARQVFTSARDAIDAVSKFEAQTAEEWEYDIRCGGTERWRVHVNCLTSTKRGFVGVDGSFIRD